MVRRKGGDDDFPEAQVDGTRAQTRRVRRVRLWRCGAGVLEKESSNAKRNTSGKNSKQKTKTDTPKKKKLMKERERRGYDKMFMVSAMLRACPGRIKYVSSRVVQRMRCGSPIQPFLQSFPFDGA